LSSMRSCFCNAKARGIPTKKGVSKPLICGPFHAAETSAQFDHGH
jgi:hypothetical protein